MGQVHKGSYISANGGHSLAYIFAHKHGKCFIHLTSDHRDNTKNIVKDVSLVHFTSIINDLSHRIDVLCEKFSTAEL